MLISIITPTRNCRTYIEECLQSTLRQNYENMEHIVVDGGSTDGTIEILEKYRNLHPGQIRIIAGQDKGPGEAWNKGLAAAQGEVLGWIGADDTYPPGVFEFVADFFEKNPSAFFIYGGQNIMDQNGQVILSCPPEDFNFDTLLNRKQMIATTSAFCRKSVFASVGTLDVMGNDFDLYLRIAKKFPIHKVNKILSNYRVHERSQTNGASVRRRKFWLKTWCHTSRCHGGRFLSNYCVKYYIFQLLGWALPVWNFIYFFILKKFKKKIL